VVNSERWNNIGVRDQFFCNGILVLLCVPEGKRRICHAGEENNILCRACRLASCVGSLAEARFQDCKKPPQRSLSSKRDMCAAGIFATSKRTYPYTHHLHVSNGSACYGVGFPRHQHIKTFLARLLECAGQGRRRHGRRKNARQVARCCLC